MITWTKTLNKGKQKWEKACVENGLQLGKFQTPTKTRFTSKVIMFGKTLKFKNAILLCYG
jgi:hypothetical protein